MVQETLFPAPLPDSPGREALSAFLARCPFGCLSGGARGADVAWGGLSLRLGVGALHWSFPGHRHSVAPGQGERHELGETELEMGAPALRRVARRIRRSLPPPWTPAGRLIRRNHWQVFPARAVFALAPLLPDGCVEGGTGWAVDLARHEFGLPVHLFCTRAEGWFHAEPGRGWRPGPAPERLPDGPWAGVGSRELPPSALLALAGLEEGLRRESTSRWEVHPSPPAGR